MCITVNREYIKPTDESRQLIRMITGNCRKTFGGLILLQQMVYVYYVKSRSNFVDDLCQTLDVAKVNSVLFINQDPFTEFVCDY